MPPACASLGLWSVRTCGGTGKISVHKWTVGAEAHIGGGASAELGTFVDLLALIITELGLVVVISRGA